MWIFLRILTTIWGDIWILKTFDSKKNTCEHLIWDDFSENMVEIAHPPSSVSTQWYWFNLPQGKKVSVKFKQKCSGNQFPHTQIFTKDPWISALNQARIIPHRSKTPSPKSREIQCQIKLIFLSPFPWFRPIKPLDPRSSLGFHSNATSISFFIHLEILSKPSQLHLKQQGKFSLPKLPWQRSKNGAAPLRPCVKANWVIGEAAVAKYRGFNDQRDRGKMVEWGWLYKEWQVCLLGILYSV